MQPQRAPHFGDGEAQIIAIFARAFGRRRAGRRRALIAVAAFVAASFTLVYAASALI